MPNYRRYRVPGGTYFLTINLLDRRSDLLIRHIDALRDAVRRTRRERPFRIDAWAVLPEHLHCIITVPEGDDDFSNRIKAIKIRFARAIPATERRSAVRDARGERAIWQRRFWEHAIRGDTDYARHMDYVHLPGETRLRDPRQGLAILHFPPTGGGRPVPCRLGCERRRRPPRRGGVGWNAEGGSADCSAGGMADRPAAKTGVTKDRKRPG